MRFNVLVTGGVYSTQCGYSALQFCKAAVEAGHTVNQVFFYRDAVTQASDLFVPQSDEFDPVSNWAQFAQDNVVQLTVCVSAGERRGLLSAAQADEFAKSASNLHACFTVEGLGALHDASLSSDRMVTFK